mmetsp:Transcript_19796/g.27291  ORF Transcript_19796/g.27291 Transcript_19796/m.27291 type:complete len:237 (+) Transcript_19796:85-795(+)
MTQKKKVDLAKAEIVELWKIAIAFIVVSICLGLPRTPSSLPFVPSTFTYNDLIDATLSCIIPLVFHKSLLELRSPSILLIPFCLIVLKAIGHGAHAVANSTEASFGDNSLLKPHIYFTHEFLAHNFVYAGELFLYAWHFSASVPSTSSPSLFFQFGNILISATHGLLVGVICVGTRTTHLLAVLWLIIISLFFQKKSSLMAWYQTIFGIVSFAFVAGWVYKFGGLPTFDDLKAQQQ